MSVTRPLPIRVLVKGQSLLHELSERQHRREQFTFPRVIEESLLSSGHGADVRTSAVASTMTNHAFRDWEEEVKAWSPDVVIVTYGYYEAVHLLLPRWFERHANSLKPRPGPIRTRYRQYLLRPIWKSFAKLQRATDTVVRARFFAHRVRRAEADLRAFIDRTREVGEPLVMLFEFLIPGARGRDWFPGMHERSEMMNVMLRRLVAEYDDPEILLIRIPEIVERRARAGIEPNADGFHFNAEVHQIVGEELADEIRTWAKRYPRLNPPD